MTNILEETNALVEKIASYCNPEKIILFGSASRGQETPKSDIDLLIIKDSGKKGAFRVKEIFEAVRGIKRDYPLDPIVYTPEEVDHRVSLGDYFIKNILDQGKIVYGR